MKFLSKVSLFPDYKTVRMNCFKGWKTPRISLASFVTAQKSTPRLLCKRYFVDALPPTLPYTAVPPAMEYLRKRLSICRSSHRYSSSMIQVLMPTERVLNTAPIHRAKHLRRDRQPLRNANSRRWDPRFNLASFYLRNEEKVMAAIDTKFGTEVPIIGAVLPG